MTFLFPLVSLAALFMIRIIQGQALGNIFQIYFELSDPGCFGVLLEIFDGLGGALGEPLGF